ncbi:MAG: IS66 family insertion sequence element accessory protein TnpB [Zoogloeaceae bacterium]|nr:IS66 family insertion sequence element accessory protein TnpB [Zoogloeaceae bacterium]
MKDGAGRTLTVHLYGAPEDMRNSFDGLCALTRRELAQDPMSGRLFVFHQPEGDANEGAVLGPQRPMRVGETARTGTIPVRLGAGVVNAQIAIRPDERQLSKS